MHTKSFLKLVLLGALACLPWTVSAQSNPNNEVGLVEHNGAVQQDISPPLRDIPDVGRKKTGPDNPLRLIPRKFLNQHDPVVQTSTATYVATTSGLNFAGVGNGDYLFVPNAAPPDTTGAVGATQYVQWVNESFAVFDKATGAIAPGFPKAGNTLWSGFGGGCQTNNDGDPIVAYDKAANRWVLTQFSVTGGGSSGYLQCVAVSTTSDATGSYNRYAFSYGTVQFPDYPKLGVWPDGYYISYNIFNNGSTFAGAKVCAFDRAKMLTGASATQVCFQLSNIFGGLLPSDLDGATAPPAGSPNTFVAFGNDAVSLDTWKFHADFTTPANSSFVHTNIPAPAFSPACSGGGTCIPQAGTSQQLDSLADRLMHRLAYRNFGDHESLVVNHSVTAGSSVGIRWYELRGISATPAVYQSGTYAPDSTYRWMGSIAMDKVGNIAVGYSASSSSINPGIRYTGRAPTDSLGTLQAETTILTGGGSQIGGLSRWGDYSAMTIDPTDDCTFFYTTEYLKSSGSFNWSTRIASFKFPSCTSAPPVLTSIKVSPASASVPTGNTQQFTAAGLDQFGNPVSPQPTFTWSVSGGGTISSTAGLFTAGATAGGPFTVTASSGTLNGTASVTVTAPAADFSLTVSPASQTVTRGNTATYTVTITGSNGFSGPVTLSLTGQPSRATVTFSPTAATSTSTLAVTTQSKTMKGTYTLTIHGVSGSLNHTATTQMIIN